MNTGVNTFWEHFEALLIANTLNTHEHSATQVAIHVWEGHTSMSLRCNDMNTLCVCV